MYELILPTTSSTIETGKESLYADIRNKEF